MPIVVIALLIFICGLASVILWVGFGCELKEGKPVVGLAISAPITSAIAIGLIIWLSIASCYDFVRSEDVAEIKTITVTPDIHQSQTYQVAVFSDGDVLNATEQFKRIYPDGTKVKQLKVTSPWVGGIYWMKGLQNKYEIVLEKENCGSTP